MKRVILWIVLMLVVTSCGYKEDGMIGQEDFIKAQGKKLVTAQGKELTLRGVNVGGYLLQEFWMTPTSPSDHIKDQQSLESYLTQKFGAEEAKDLLKLYQDSYFTEADFDQCQELGMNVLRLPFWTGNFVNEAGTIRQDWYEIFDWFLEEAGKRNLYVILDFHGAPGSQSGSDHSGIDGEDDKEGASKFFFGTPEETKANQALYYEIWTLIAKRYKDNPVVAGYDLLNEPYCTYRYTTSRPASELHELLWGIYDEAYKRIRAVDPDHMIIMEATWDPIDLPHPDRYGWENVMYEYHNYLYDDYNNEKGLQIENMKKKLRLIEKANYPVPSYMGEFSYFNNLDAWAEGLALLNDADLSWTIWTYRTMPTMGNWGLYHHESATTNLEVLSKETLEVIWSKVGNQRPNNRLLETIKPYF